MDFHFQEIQHVSNVRGQFNTKTVAIEEYVAGNGAVVTGTTGGLHLGTVAIDAITSMHGRLEI